MLHVISLMSAKQRHFKIALIAGRLRSITSPVVAYPNCTHGIEGISQSLYPGRLGAYNPPSYIYKKAGSNRDLSERELSLSSDMVATWSIVIDVVLSLLHVLP